MVAGGCTRHGDLQPPHQQRPVFDVRYVGRIGDRIRVVGKTRKERHWLIAREHKFQFAAFVRPDERRVRHDIGMLAGNRQIKSGESE